MEEWRRLYVRNFLVPSIFKMAVILWVLFAVPFKLLDRFSWNLKTTYFGQKWSELCVGNLLIPPPPRFKMTVVLLVLFVVTVKRLDRASWNTGFEISGAKPRYFNEWGLLLSELYVHISICVRVLCLDLYFRDITSTTSSWLQLFNNYSIVIEEFWYSNLLRFSLQVMNDR